MHFGTAHVAVNQEYALSELREADRDVARDDRLALGGSGARDHHRAARPFRKREHDVGAQLTDALEELLADTVAQKRHFMPLRPSLVTHFRNETKERNTKARVYLVWCLDAVVEKLEAERQ